MSPFAKLMLRLGWIRLSSFGLEVTLDGRLVPHSQIGSASLTVSPAETRLLPPVPCAEPLAASASVQMRTAETLVEGDLEANVEEVDEWAWRAAVAKAKANREATLEEEIAFADTTPMPAQELGKQTAVEADSQDWEVLMNAARARAETEQTCPEFQAAAIEPKLSPPNIDLAAAQVEQGAQAANDDLPSDQVTSIHTRLRSQSTASEIDAEEEEEWSQLRTQVAATERNEDSRKLRAMREIRRLQTRTRVKDFQPMAPPPAGRPARNIRVAGGTTPISAARTPKSAGTTPMMARKAPPVSAQHPHNQKDQETKVSGPLPRITGRL